MTGLILLCAIAYGIYFLFFKRFYILIKDKGPAALSVIKLIKDANPNMGLAKAKEAVDNAPYIAPLGKLPYSKAKSIVTEANKSGAVTELYIHFPWKGKLPIGRQTK